MKFERITWRRPTSIRRWSPQRRPSTPDIAELITRNLDQTREALIDGAVVSMIRDRVRVRRLPIE